MKSLIYDQKGFHNMAFLKSMIISLALCSFTSSSPQVKEDVIRALQEECDLAEFSCAGRPTFCRCDPGCSFYGDCCFDSSYRENWTRRNAQCEQGGYVINKCPLTWDDEKLKYYCEIYANKTDPLSTLPIHSMRSGLSYRNHYCAVCNDDAISFHLWPISVVCSSSEIKDINLGDLKYDRYYSTWGVWNVNSRGETSFVPCNITSVRMFENDNDRICSYAVDKCAPDWNNELVRDKCESYQLLVTLPFSVSTSLYRNIHCAHCNHIDISEVKCFKRSGGSGFSGGGIGGASFHKLFDFNSLEPKDIKCKGGEVYNPFLEECQALKCLPLQKIVGNKCVYQ